jgi:SNF2 family DNA or RNA helicase
LGTWSFFRSHYVHPITKEGSQQIEKKLSRLISPFILRRTKNQEAPELPPLTEEVIDCEMSPEQLEIYQKEKNRIRNSFLEEWTKNKLLALNGISRLRQLANHPKLVYPEFEGCSGKMEQILDTYETILSEGHKVLMFSSYVKHLELVADEFKRKGWDYAMLTGATLDREKEIARFARDSTVSAFLISLKAGGVGLNLTEADYVFILDPWWNPAAEMQAESRAHRIGQNKQVFVYRFISANTIEEKIRALQERKSRLVKTFISENDPLEALTDDDWRELLRE